MSGPVPSFFREGCKIIIDSAYLFSSWNDCTITSPSGKLSIRKRHWEEGLTSMSILKLILDFFTNQIRHIYRPDAVAEIFRLSKRWKNHLIGGLKVFTMRTTCIPTQRYAADVQCVRRNEWRLRNIYYLEWHHFPFSTISNPHPEVTKVYEDLLYCCKYPAGAIQTLY